MSLAVVIHPVIDIITIRTHVEAFTYETSAKSKKNVGKVKKRSTITIKALSIFPRKYPAIEPNKRPMKEAIRALPTPIVKDTFPPSIKRAKISRPSLSVPKICVEDGATKIA